jgi:hypothetical protein
MGVPDLCLGTDEFPRLGDRPVIVLLREVDVHYVTGQTDDLRIIAGVDRDALDLALLVYIPEQDLGDLLCRDVFFRND